MRIGHQNGMMGSLLNKLKVKYKSLVINSENVQMTLKMTLRKILRKFSKVTLTVTWTTWILPKNDLFDLAYPQMTMQK